MGGMGNMNLLAWHCNVIFVKATMKSITSSMIGNRPFVEELSEQLWQLHVCEEWVTERLYLQQIKH